MSIDSPICLAVLQWKKSIKLVSFISIELKSWYASNVCVRVWTIYSRMTKFGNFSYTVTIWKILLILHPIVHAPYCNNYIFIYIWQHRCIWFLYENLTGKNHTHDLSDKLHLLGASRYQNLRCTQDTLFHQLLYTTDKYFWDVS